MNHSLQMRTLEALRKDVSVIPFLKVEQEAVYALMMQEMKEEEIMKENSLEFLLQLPVNRLNTYNHFFEVKCPFSM